MKFYFIVFKGLMLYNSKAAQEWHTTVTILSCKNMHFSDDFVKI